MRTKLLIGLVATSAVAWVVSGQTFAEQAQVAEPGSGAASAEQGAQERKVSLVAGHNVVDAVDDVRETVADLAHAIIDASETAEFAAWEPVREPLQNTISELDEMEVRLDRKAEATDSSWLNWLEDRDYSVTVKNEIEQIGNALDEMARLVGPGKDPTGLQVVTGHNVVDAVDDVRETVADLNLAMGDAGPEWGWFDDEALFTGYQERLDAMEQTLDEKAELTDAEWETWLGDPEYHVFVQEQVQTLSNMLTEMSQRISV